ncbi:CLC_0170 family protein [Cohnella sp. GCM10012308]|uniref:CLC_0170 family protein n=1 Tax=Cohnella sp. GCM10012308 TaxID=3317329 RepID=UPI00360CD5FA
MPIFVQGVNYYAFSIPIWFLGGALVLLVDARRCREAGHRKDEKFARFAGWLNIALGACFLVREWVV